MEIKLEQKKSLVEKVTGIYDTGSKLWLMLGFFTLALLVFQSVKYIGAKPNPLVEGIKNFPCELSQELQEFDTSDLKTTFAVSAIDLETEVVLLNENQTKNHIPPIVSPEFSSFEDIENCFNKDEEVIVLEVQETVKVYPYSILSQHLIVNDKIAGEPVLISYCGFCNSYSVYLREFENEILYFGYTGFIYKNSDLIFDHKTESLWTAFSGESVIGNFVGGKLASVPYKLMTFQQARNQFPQANVLNFKTGSIRPYQIDAYAGFSDSNEVISPILNRTQKLELKEMIIGIDLAEQKYAIPMKLLTEGTNEFTTKNGDSVIVNQNKKVISVIFNNQTIPSTKQSYWYVWFDFYPETELLVN